MGSIKRNGFWILAVILSPLLAFLSDAKLEWMLRHSTLKTPEPGYPYDDNDPGMDVDIHE